MHFSHIKRISFFIMAVMVLTFCFPVMTSCSADTGFRKEGKVYIEGYTYGGKFNLETLEMKTAAGEYYLKFDSDWLTERSNEEYNSELAEFCVLLSSDIYPDVYVTFDKSEADPGDNEKLLSDIGFEDVTFSEITDGPSGTDEDDGTALVMAHRTVCTGGTCYDVFVAVVSGTRNEVTSDWLSNFDVGSDDTEYYLRTGDHPEWTVKEQHKGFDVAAARVRSSIDEYISEYRTDGSETRLLLTGHSRGGAVANILGAVYEDDPEIYSYSYSVACPTTTTYVRKEYKTVFNLVNSEDFVSVMPLPEWGFGRYGTDINGTVSEYSSEYSELTGLSYASPDIEEIQKAFSAVAENADRSDLYATHEYVLKTDEDYTTDGPDAIEALGVEEFFELSVTPENGNTETDGEDVIYTSQYCNAFLLKAIAYMIADRNDIGQIVLDTVNTDVLLDLAGQDIENGGNLRDAFSTLIVSAPSLPWPHFTASYLILAAHSGD